VADSSNTSGRRVRLSIDVDPDLKRRIRIAAAERDLSIKDYLEMVVRRELEGTTPVSPPMPTEPSSAATDDADWSQNHLARPSARDTRYWET
jgi:hypothetical protein